MYEKKYKNISQKCKKLGVGNEKILQEILNKLKLFFEHNAVFDKMQYKEGPKKSVLDAWEKHIFGVKKIQRIRQKTLTRMVLDDKISNTVWTEHVLKGAKLRL